MISRVLDIIFVEFALAHHRTFVNYIWGGFDLAIQNDRRPDAWILIPARGGSVGIPRKNLRMLNGKPLITYVISTALQVLSRERVIVVTDDEEIAHISDEAGATVLLEPIFTPGGETLDVKVLRNIPALRESGARDEDIVVTVQPTSPLLSSSSIRRAVREFQSPGVGTALTVVDDRHLRWGKNESDESVPLFKQRLNRQQLPPEFRETGGIIASRLIDIERQGTRIIEPVVLVELSADEAIDIDSYSDLYAAAHLLSRKSIAIRVDASRTLGMGHVYRMHSFAAELSRHEITIFLSESCQLGREFFSRYPYSTVLVSSHEDFCSKIGSESFDLVVLDILDTSAEQIREIRVAAPRAKVVSFEDRGSGALEVDLLVAEFITNTEVPPSKKIEGIDHALLSPNFENGIIYDRAISHEVGNVLVLFGGTDPSRLAEKTLKSLSRVGYSQRVTLVRGLGASQLDFDHSELNFELEVLENISNMPVVIAKADFAFTSAGRTVVELLSQGVPSICLAQNEKELTHTHATSTNGVLHLGLGTEVEEKDLDEATSRMLSDKSLRNEYAARARNAGKRRKNSTTISTILTRIGFEDFPEI